MAIVEVKRLSIKEADKVHTYSIQNSATGQHSTLSLSIPSPSQSQEFKWYLEDYAEKSPFETSRATKASHGLAQHGRELIASIEWNTFLDAEELENVIIFRVEESGEDGGPHVFWELLEREDLWEYSQPKALNAVVVRTARFECATGASPILPVPSLSDHNRSFNILVVTARPNAAKDIEHRLVSKIIVDVAQAQSRVVSVEIVRPGSFDALKTHLQIHMPGFFDIVHFDMHGIADPSGLVCLAFVKPPDEAKHFKFSIDYRDATEVGELLKQSEVRQVVLNACQSAYGTNAETNIAVAFIRSGVSVVAAMAYKVSSESVDVFTRCLYTGLLRDRFTLEGAVFLARSAMLENPKRRSKFGKIVKLDDFTVPVVYQNSAQRRGYDDALSRHVRFPAGSDPPLLESSEAHAGLNVESFVFGRENDILQLESALLIGKLPVLLTGQAGIGKTLLLHHLVEWWRTTGLIDEAFYFRPLEGQELNLDLLYQDMQKQFVGISAYSNPQRVLNYIENHRCLIVLDSLESLRIGRKYGQLLNFIKTLNSKNALVVIASRRKERWLSSHTITHKLSGLWLIPGLQVIDGAVRLYRHTLLESTLNGGGDFDQTQLIPECNSEEDRQYLEEIISLVKGNPLVLRLLVLDNLCVTESPKEYFFGLLAGAPVEIDLADPCIKDWEGLRSIAQLGDLIDQLTNVVPTYPVSTINPYVLAPFWDVLPVEDFEMFLKLVLLRTSIQMSKPENSDIFPSLVTNINNILPKEILKLLPDFMPVLESFKSDQSQQKKDINTFFTNVLIHDRDFPDHDISKQMVKTANDRLISALTKASFLEGTSDEIPTSLGSHGYMKLHPLVPILLRTQPIYQANVMGMTQATKEAFIQYQIFRSKKWPFDKAFYHPAWEAPREQLHYEFVNFISAAEMRPLFESENYIQDAMAYQMMAMLDRGAHWEPSRLRVIGDIYKKALPGIMEQIEVMKAEEQQSIRTEIVKQSSPFGNDPNGSIAKFMLMILRFIALHFTYMYTAWHYMEKDKLKEFASVYAELSRDIKEAGLPDISQIPGGPASTSFEILQTTMEPYLEMCGYFTTGEPLTQGQEARILEITHMMGGKELAPYQKQTIYEYGDIVSGTKGVIHMVRYTQEIDAAFKAGEYQQAERLIDEAMLVEINEKTNNPMSRAALLHLRSALDDQQGRWDDAMEHFEEACALEDLVGANVVDYNARLERKMGIIARKSEAENSKMDTTLVDAVGFMRLALALIESNGTAQPADNAEGLSPILALLNALSISR